MRLRSNNPNTSLADGYLRIADCNENDYSSSALFAALICCLSVATAAGQVKADAAIPTKQDSTFVFSADVHVGFNGTDDTHGFYDLVSTNSSGAFNASVYYIGDETAASSPSFIGLPRQEDGCIRSSINPPLPALKDLCNQIQHVREVNALPTNNWPPATFTDASGHSRTLQSQGLIPQPRGLVIGGDMTDCAGGNDEYCINYTGSNTAQLVAFESLYDIFLTKSLSFNSMSFLPGLVNPDASTPVHMEVFPGLGNHDIDNPGISNNMFNFVTQHVAALQARDSSGAANWNFNSATTAYSWNWGNLHVVNVGVYPGSLNDYTGSASGINYNWSPDSDAFLLNDLKNNAYDGRPVVIASHFGFDDYSLGTGWWNASNRVCGLTDLWTELNKFNVVGYYHGHNHGYHPFDANVNIQYAYKYPNIASAEGLPTKAPRPKIPYDAFLPGAAYYQSLAVTRVTDSQMDVAMPNSGFDFVNGNNRTIDFASTALFTKVLTPAPVVVGAPWADNALETQILGFNVGNQSYVIGVDTLGIFLIRSINAAGAPTFLSGGQFSSPVISMASYAAQDGTHILVTGSNAILDYTFTQNHLAYNWTASISGGSIMTFAKGTQNYLVVDYHPAPGLGPLQETLTIFQINSNGLSAVGTPYNPLFPVLSNVPQLQTYQLSNLNRLGMIEFDPDYGTAIFYSIDLNAFSILQTNKEQWAAGRMRILNFPYGEVQILLTTPSGIMAQPSDYTPYLYAGTSSSYCPASPHYWPAEIFSAQTFPVPAANPDSPVYVFSLLTDPLGNNFTDVSWRGLPFALPYLDVPAYPSNPNQTRPPMPPQTIDSFVTSAAGGSMYVSSYHASGLLTRLSFSQPTGVNVTFSPNSQSVTITVNGTPVTVPGTISLTPGQTYTLSAPASFSPQAGFQYSNPTWSNNVNPNGTFTVPSADTTVYLNYQAQIQITTAANPPGAGTINGGGWIPLNNVVSFQATPNAGYTFGSFSGLAVSPTNPLTFKVTYPGQVTADFSTAGGPSLSVTTQGARTDGPKTDERTVPLEVVSGNGSGIGNVIVTAIDGIQVLTGTGSVSVAGGLAATFGDLPPDGTANFNVVMNWPATAARVRFVVHLQGNSGAYNGSSTLTLNR